jgi:3-oxoacyl-[acyl-carrier-protein] synthase II
MLSHPVSAPTDRVARELGPFSRVRSLSSACSSGANAILVGATWLELDLVDAVVCGAADALCRVTLCGFNALGACDPGGARPFDVKRKGLTLGEGAGFLVLERADGARARGKKAICTLAGWASRSEAHHITNPEPKGEAPFRAMRAALARAGLSASDVDYVNAHGTGTPLNDPMESRALARALGDEVKRVPVSSAKGQIGHTLAAAGAVEAVITALALDRGIVPPTGGLSEPDPECRLVHVQRAEKRALRAAMTSSFGFGGMDTVLVFAKDANNAKDATCAPRGPRRVVVAAVATLTPAGLRSGTEVTRVPDDRVEGSVAPIPEGALDMERARRLDRASRLGAVVCGRALTDAPCAEEVETGIVLGSAFGALDATSGFMRRLREKGARLLPPAEFPSLVPSSPAGHVSIYLGLGGPAFVVADLAASGESAFVQGWELVASGQVDRVCVAAVEERSALVESVLRVVFGGADDEAAARSRREGGAAIVLAPEEAAVGAKEAGAKRVLARVERAATWNDESDFLASFGAPPAGAIVVLGVVSPAIENALASSAWAACPRLVCSEGAGTHEAAGGIAIAVAAGAIARGDAPSALVVGIAQSRAYAGLLSR